MYAIRSYYALANYRGPILIVTAADDEIIPAAEGRRLYYTLNTSAKRWQEIPGAHHSDWIERTAAADWQDWLAFVGNGSP